MAWMVKTLQQCFDEGESFTVDVVTTQPNPEGEDTTITTTVEIIKSKTTGGITKYQCQACLAMRQAFALVDCRNINSITDDFICDGCLTNRQRKKIMTGNKTVTEKEKDANGKRICDGLEAKAEDELQELEWLEDWITEHGAPPELLLKIKNDKDAKKAIKAAEKNKRLTT